jgi:hypothetical protein
MDGEHNIQRRGSLARIRPAEDERILVFGDIHGDIDSLKRGLSLRRRSDYVVFLGDYADRGSEGVEVIEGIDMLLDRYPEKVVALKGNHEEYTGNGEPTFSPCTLIQEAERKRGSWREFFDATFSPFLRKLSLSALVPGGVLFVHGGIGEGIDSADALESPDESLERTVLWSDPGSEPGTSLNMRGAGTVFGPDITETVLRNVDAGLVVRSHEPRRAVTGPAFDHDEKIVTVSSTRIYDGRPFVLLLSAAQLTGEVSREDIQSAIRYLDE